ncbi:MAG: hypothetical protein HRT71_16280, partial [Flavobacteriales bacterium]|nr:hypothetical protein [Flavobacteriales bacterium]
MAFKKIISICLIAVITALSFNCEAQTIGKKLNIDSLKSSMMESLQEFFDVEMLGHSIQARSIGKNGKIKASFDKIEVQPKADFPIFISIYTNINIDEFWPNVLTGKYKYTTDGKIDIDENTGLFAFDLGFRFDTIADNYYDVKDTVQANSFLKNVFSADKIKTFETALDSIMNIHVGPNVLTPKEAHVALAVDNVADYIIKVIQPVLEKMAAKDSLGFAGYKELYNKLLNGADYLDATESEYISFKAPTEQKYGFSAYTNFDKSGFEEVELNDKSYYYTSLKTIAPDATGETVIAEIHGISNYSDTLLKFMDKKNNVVNHVVTTAGIVVSPTSGAETVYAMYGLKRLGKFNVYPVKQMNIKIDVVKLAGTSIGTDTEIEDTLKKIYKGANVVFDIEVLTEEFEYANANITIDDFATMSRYSTSMKDLYKAYFKAHPRKKDRAYLFVVDDIYLDTKTLAGYMPRNKAIGFVQSGASALEIGHELGHGLFGLAHTWDLKDPAPKETTKNLMDYSGGQEMLASQWLQIQDPNRKLYAFDDAED